MIKEIVNQVFQLKVPIPYDFGEVNCYLIHGKKGYTIIDTGDYTEEAMTVWRKALAGNIPIEKVIVTHAHTDHIGLAGWFQQQFNAPVWMSAKSYDELKRIRSLFVDQKYTGSHSAFLVKHGGQIYPEQENQFHMYKSYQFEPNFLFTEDEELTIGDRAYETIWTPGHSPDHFSFYNRENQILFVGDHILKSVNPIVMCEREGENPLKGYMDSLTYLSGLPTKYVLPGHGDLIFNLNERIQVMTSHYQKRWRQTYQAIHEEGSTAFQVSQYVYGTHLPQHREGSAFIQTITNLIYLESLEYIRKEEQGGKYLFYQIK